MYYISRLKIDNYFGGKFDSEIWYTYSVLCIFPIQIASRIFIYTGRVRLRLIGHV